MAEPVPAATAGPSQSLHRRPACDARPSELPGPSSLPCTTGNKRSAQPAAGSSPDDPLAGAPDEAQHSTVTAALDVFMRTFPDFADRKEECRAALLYTYRADSTIFMCVLYGPRTAPFSMHTVACTDACRPAVCFNVFGCSCCAWSWSAVPTF